MNLKQKKPIHLKCPKCGYDFAYNTNHIEEEIERLKYEVTSIINKITKYKKEHPNSYCDNWYKKAQRSLKIKNLQLQELKKARKATVVEIELQKHNIFKQLVEEELGKEKTSKLLDEAEEQMVYYDWDMATQTFTRFEGV